MATKDINTGLLSKMAKFVRNPTKDWSDLDKPEPEQESGYSKLALKEIIERKRQNDFVRRREFDNLRKLRRNGPSVSPDLADRPSFFQSSMASNQDERAMTLKKIDEIEAQMSKQWWKGRPGEPTVQGGIAGSNFPIAANTDETAGDSIAMSVAPRERTSVFKPTHASELSPDSEPAQSVEYEPTQMGLAEAADTAPPGTPQPMMAFRRSGSRNFDTGISEFSTSKLFAVELGDAQADPDLEEAAIRFANGDDAGAEAGLLTALQGDNVQPDAADRWAGALFDLYRSTGQQASFDSVAIDYAMRFGRSAPAWFSTPELLGRNALVSPVHQTAAPAQSHSTVWACPAELDVPAMQALLASLSPAPGPWHLNWSLLKAITPDAAQALAGLFAQWCAQPVKLHFGGAEVLEKTLMSYTPSGDKRVDVFWWRLRLDALRILRLQDEFELAALDYCVIYEVSPPPWAEAPCEFVHERMSSATPLELAYPLPGEAVSGRAIDFSQGLTAPMGLDAMPAALVELTGEVLGDAAEALDQLQAGLKGADRLVISCARLIRVDFSAAGSILNWVAVRESEGCHVQFRDVPRLVAAFFNVIGINEHARVMLRTS
jgi:ABC-type transporter Mla MlaB component